ncbi:MAG TPA: ABC transporter permease [Candidatus Limnocylindrales bacterium]|nr:ABC transporter permease [Candidatus Limnocylindrales bacterium]
MLDAIRNVVIGWVKAVGRLLAQIRKELIQVRRRPGAFISLILGPFLVMAVFGLGYTGVRSPLETVVVVPQGGVDAPEDLPSDQQFYQDLAGPALNITEVTTDADWARRELEAGRISTVVVLPADAPQRIRAGERAQIEVLVNEVDPVQVAYTGFVADIITSQINREILTRMIAEGETYAVTRLDEEPLAVPAEVIAAPTEMTVSNVAAIQPSVVIFFGPAVLALVLQHMAVTLTALSFVRERMSGVMEVFKISPVTSVELVLGKYLGLGIVGAVVATITTLLLITILGVPMLGDPWWVVMVIFLLTFASLGLGLLISVVADSERQAVQLSLLVLLASVFFSGFVLPVEEFSPAVRLVSYSLPVTHGIQLLQDVMLRGWIYSWWQVTTLAAIGIVLFVLTTILLRRTIRAR